MTVKCPACECAFDPEPGVPYRCPNCHSRIIGAYCDATRIGGGSMGDVYRARRPDMGNRIVAVKVPKSNDPQSRRRFDRESAATALLQHENIVRAIDCGTDQGRDFLVLEYVEGELLADVVKREHPLPCRRVAQIVRAITSGLAHAARRGIVNRDVKPENIMVTRPEGAKLLDFGLALINRVERAVDRTTNEGTRLGTAAFMAPEQAVDPRDIGPAADIYALGCTGFFALTGMTPFRGNTIDILKQHAQAARPLLQGLRPDVPREFESLLHRMMAIAAEDRPTAETIVQRLDEMLPKLPEQIAALSGLEGYADDEIVDGTAIDEDFGAGDVIAGEVIAGEVVAGEVVAGEVVAGELPDHDILEGVVVDAAEEHGDFAGQTVAGADDAANPWNDGEFAAPPRASTDEGDEADAIETLPVSAIQSSDASSDGDSAPDSSEPDSDFTPRVLLAETQEWPAIASAVEAGPVSGLPPLAATTNVDLGSQPAPIDSTGITVDGRVVDTEVAIVELPASAIVGREDAGRSPAGRPRSPRGRSPQPKRRIMRGQILMLSVFLLVAVALAAGLVVLLQPPHPNALWKQAETAFFEDRFQESETKFAEFAKLYPADPRTTYVPFFEDWTPARRETYLLNGDPEKGLELLDQLYLKYRDDPVYGQYRGDLFDNYRKLVEAFAGKRKRAPSPADVANARRALQGLGTVLKSLAEGDVHEADAKMVELSALVDAADADMQRDLARQQVLGLLALPDEPDEPIDYDAVYAQAEAVLVDHPELRSDTGVQAALSGLRKSEVERVVYAAPEERDLVEPTSSDSSQIVYVVWGEPSSEEFSDSSTAVHVALAGGVLYAFASDGRHLWSRRLGIDSSRIPLRIQASANSPEVLLAVSTLNNSLEAIVAANGKTQWRYEVELGQNLAAPLTLCRWRPEPHMSERLRGLLATTTGDVHVLELVRGQPIGRYRTGVPMTSSGGVFDPVSQLAYMPADGKRIFALNPAVIEGAEDAAAKSILVTNHANGSLRSSPVVVGPYLMTIESSDLSHTRVRAFEIDPTIGFRDPQAAPVQEMEFAGWSWFSPPTTPDRMTIVTDVGILGVLGLNLDNPAEALYSLIENDDGKLPRLTVHAPHRAMAIHSEEHLLWLMAGGKLQQFRLNVLEQEVALRWPAEDATETVRGIPLHEAEFDRDQERIYVTLQSLQGESIEFAAVAAASGEPLWRRQLGVHPLIDPIPLAQGVLLIDRSGRTLAVRTTEDGRQIVLQRDPFPPPDAPTRPPMRITDEHGESYLAQAVDGGRKVAIRKLAENGAASRWILVSLGEGTLWGRPTIADDHLVAVSSVGSLFRIPLAEAGVDRANPYRLPFAGSLAPNDPVELLAVAGDQVVLLAGDSIFWLAWQDSGPVPSWKQRPQWFHSPAPLTRQMARVSEAIYVADQDNTLYRFESSNPESAQRWRSEAEITDGPFVRGKRVLAVVGGRTLVAFDPASGDLAPAWSMSFARRICGRPVEYGEHLLVTTLAEGVVRIDPQSGKRHSALPLAQGVMPAKSAVQLGKNGILIPMSDGTLLWQVPQRARGDAL